MPDVDVGVDERFDLLTLSKDRIVYKPPFALFFDLRPGRSLISEILVTG
jgi:hypothetical protein